MTKQLILTTAAVMAAALCRGEAQRTVRTLENNFPELHQLELGVNYRNFSFAGEGDASLNTVGATLRYGLLEKLTAYAEVPAASFDSDDNDDGAGLGDIRVGVQLLAYEDVFEYPWVIPHIDVTLATGDENEGLGTGETSAGFGISVGSRMYDQFSFVLDGSYVLNGGLSTGSTDTDDAFVIGFSFVADISEQLAFVGEYALALVDNDGDTEFGQSAEDDPRYIGGGMTYRWNDQLTLGFNAGSWDDSALDTEMSVRASYEF